MHVHIERHRNFAVVRPLGRFFGGNESQELEHRLGALLDAGVRGIIVDLERTLHLNSTAIGVLVGAYQRAAARGVDLRLCNADRGIHSMLVILKLVNVMPVDETLEKSWAALVSPEIPVRSGQPTSAPVRSWVPVR